MRWKLMVAFCLLAFAFAGCADSTLNAKNTPPTGFTPFALNATATPDNSLPAPTGKNTPQPGSTPHPDTTPTITHKPIPTPVVSSGNGTHHCDSGNCSNPWNYTIHIPQYMDGEMIYGPPSGFCDWFLCIANFSAGKGYVVVCFDGKMSKSGGLDGVCSGHGGQWTPLYHLTGPAPGPTPKPTPTPRPPTPVPPTPTPVPPTPEI